MIVSNVCGLHCCYLDVEHEKQHTLPGLMSWGFCFMLGWLSEFVFLHFGRLVVDTDVWMVLVFYTYCLF